MRAELAIAVDLGGTQVRAALVDSSASILAQVAEKTLASRGGEAVLDQIVRMVEHVSQNIQQASIQGVGLCAPGPLDAKSGMALSTPTIKGFTNLPIGQILEQKLPWSVAVENDGIAAAMGEWRHGAGQGVDNLVYVTVSTGIGGGVIADRQVFHGRLGMAGHVGHMTVIANGAKCVCGNRGCWEAHASGPAFTRYANECIAQSDRSALKSIDEVTAKHVFSAAREGDELALELVQQEAKWLGLGIVNLLHLYSPDLVVMGGGMARDFDMLHEPIERYIAEHAMPPFRAVSVIKSRFGDNSGIMGAASLILHP